MFQNSIAVAGLGQFQSVRGNSLSTQAHPVTSSWGTWLCSRAVLALGAHCACVTDRPAFPPIPFAKR